MFLPDNGRRRDSRTFPRTRRWLCRWRVQARFWLPWCMRRLFRIPLTTSAPFSQGGWRESFHFPWLLLKREIPTFCLTTGAALLIDRQDTFFGSVRTTTVLDLVMSPALKTSPPPSYLTGMFVAQCKLVISQPLGAAPQCRGRAHDRCRRAIDGRAASDGDAPGDQPSGIGEQKAARYAT